MKRIVALLTLLLCAQARAELETWEFQGAALFADDGDFALFTGPAGSLTGHFNYDTSTHTITSFLLNAGGAIFSSHTPEIQDCPLVRCTGSALVPSSTKLVFEEDLTPASDERLEVFLDQPLESGHGSVTLDPRSLIYYNYGLSTIHVLGGSLVLSNASAFNAPEPASFATLLFGLGISVIASRTSRRSGVSAGSDASSALSAQRSRPGARAAALRFEG